MSTSIITPAAADPVDARFDLVITADSVQATVIHMNGQHEVITCTPVFVANLMCAVATGGRPGIAFVAVDTR